MATTTRFRCKCGAALIKQPLHQQTDLRAPGTFRMNGKRVRNVGKKFVCKTHGTQKLIYN